MGGVLHIECIPYSLEKRNGGGGSKVNLNILMCKIVCIGGARRAVDVAGCTPVPTRAAKKETPTVRSGSVWLASRDFF